MELDEDAVICDFAETYHIYDLYQYPCQYIATLAAGLRDNSRIRMKQKGLRITPELFALSLAADRINTMWWWKTEDGHNGVNPPGSLLKYFSGETKAESNRVRTYQSGDDFRAEWSRLAGEGES